MARLWGDGFDHYGSDEGNLLDGAYANAGSAVSLVTSPVATGTHSILISGIDAGGSFRGLRKVLPSAKDKLGAFGRFYFSGLPLGNQGSCVFNFLSSNPLISQVCCIVDSSGGLSFYRGTNGTFSGLSAGTLIAQSDPLLTANAFNSLEVQVSVHDTDGWVRAAVNGVHRYEATGLDTKQDSSNVVSVAQHIRPTVGSASDFNFYIEDYYIYDFTGTAATDTDWCPTVDGSGVATNYIGELQPMLCLATADTAEADWAKSTGSDGYPLIGKATPDDTSYIYSGTATDLSEFELTDLPADITYIRGLDFHSRISKSDAGAAMYKVGMKSDASTSDATEIPMTVDPTYWYAQINVDPDTSARWTRPSFNAAWLRQLRSA